MRRSRPPRSRAGTRERALDALSLMRRKKYSLTKAAKAVRANPRTVKRYVGDALERKGRRYKPTESDRLPREMRYLGPDGPEWVTVRDSMSATLLGEHANAIGRYMRGDEEALKRLDAKTVKIGGRRRPLLTDLATIDRLFAGSELHYELYRR